MKRSPVDAMHTIDPSAAKDPGRRVVLQLAAAGTLGALLPAGIACADSAPVATLPAAANSVRPLAAERLASALRDALLASLNLIPVTGGFLSFIGALFIPVAGKTAEELWREYVDQAISESLFRLVRADLEGLSAVVGFYRQVVDSGDLDTLGSQSISANAIFAAAMPRFRLAREEVALLPLYVVAATMHLSLLRDMVLKAQELGFTPALRTSLQVQLSRCIKEYTQHVDTQVAAALEKAKADNPNRDTPQTRNQPFAAMLDAKAGLQTAVIDIRDTWYAFDAIMFPGPVRVRLEREIIFLAGWWDSNSRAPEAIPSYPLPTSTLRRLEFWQHTFARVLYLAGVSLDYADGTQLRTGEINGLLTTIDLPPNAYVNRVSTHFGSAVERIELGVGSNPTWRTVGTRRTLTDPAIVAPPDHRLSSIRSAGGARLTDGKDDCGYIIGFQLVNQEAMPMSVDLFDRVAPNIAPRLREWIVGD